MPHNIPRDSFEHQLTPNPSINIQIPAPKIISAHVNHQETTPEEPKSITELEPILPINRKF
jgi:hypothetical protein